MLPRSRPVLLCALLLCHASCAGPSRRPTVASDKPIAGGTTLTIYSSADPSEPFPTVSSEENPYYETPSGFGVIRERRQLNLREGINRVEVTDIAALIDPTTVVFRSLNEAAATTVLEQNLEFDVASARKIPAVSR